MRASIVDLRYKMHDVIKAIERNEKVVIMFHGKEKAVMRSISKSQEKKIEEHQFFAMYKDAKKSVEEIMTELRGKRYGDL